MIFVSCGKESKNSIDVSEVSIDFEMNRFDVDFYQSNPKDLTELKKEYPFLFPVGIHDSIWRRKIEDKEEQELFQETQKVFQDLSEIEKDLMNLFKHIKYYNPTFKSPRVISVLSNIDYEYKTIYSDSLLLISLDAYLGKNHPFYVDFPNYIKENNTQERIVVDVANEITHTQVKPSFNRSFIGKMIYAGKKMYLLDLYLPEVSDEIKIGYSKEKISWAEENEEQIWKYFIEKNLLYSTDTKLNKRFLEEAPFSKFFLSEDRNSPGRVGQWIGWQIVKSFVRNNDVSLQSLLKMSEEEIFKRSKYKPRK